MKTQNIIIIFTLIFSSCLTTNDWFVLKSTDLGFEIEFPNEPKFTQQTSMTEYGKQDFNIYVLESDNLTSSNLNYFAAKTIYPDSLIDRYKNNIDEFFNSSIQNSIESVQGKKIHDKVIYYLDYPGREVKFDFKNGEAVITMRIYLVDNAVYLLQTITYPEKD